MNPIQTSTQAELEYRHERIAKDFAATPRRASQARSAASRGHRRYLIKIGARRMA